MITGDVKDAEWRHNIRRLSTVLGQELPEVIRDEGRLFLRDLIRSLPPKTQAQGRQAVERDIRRAVELLDQKDWEDPRLREAIRRKDYAAVRAIFSRIHRRKGWQVLPFDPQLHRSRRDRRGRVQSQKKVATLDRVPYRRYLRQQQSKVGLLKAHFAYALVRLGGKAPAWLSRHFGAVANKYADRLADTRNPRFIVKGDFFQGSRVQEFVDFALRLRINRMGRRIDNIIRKTWSK